MISYKTGIFHWFGYILPFEERIKLIKQEKYDYVMLWWEDESYPYSLSRFELIKVLQYYDLMLDNVHLPFEGINNLWSENNSIRNNEINLIKKYINECKNCGADTVVMHNVQGNNHVFNYYTGYNSFESVIKEAENINIKIAFENTQIVEYTDFLLKEIDSPNLGFCYDSSHDFIQGGTFGQILKKWNKKIIAVHLSDNDGLYDRHWIPGKGHVKWEEIINILKESNIKSYSMETYPFEEERNLQPSIFLKKAKQELIQMIN